MIAARRGAITSTETRPRCCAVLPGAEPRTQASRSRDRGPHSTPSPVRALLPEPFSAVPHHTCAIIAPTGDANHRPGGRPPSPAGSCRLTLPLSHCLVGEGYHYSHIKHQCFAESSSPSVRRSSRRNARQARTARPPTTCSVMSPDLPAAHVDQRQIMRLSGMPDPSDTVLCRPRSSGAGCGSP